MGKVELVRLNVCDSVKLAVPLEDVVSQWAVSVSCDSINSVLVEVQSDNKKRPKGEHRQVRDAKPFSEPITCQSPLPPTFTGVRSGSESS